MADISHVESAMVSIIASSLGLGDSYLDGSLVLSPLAATKCRVYRGWPVSQALDDDLSAGIVNVSVFPPAGHTRNITRHLLEWKPGQAVTPTLIATVSGATVTITGTVALGQVVGVRFGAINGGTNAAYRVLAADTVSSVAAALQALIASSTVSGAVLTLPSALNVKATVVADQPMWMETRRQEAQVRVSIWSPTPAARDIVAPACDQAFANLQDQYGRQTNQFGLPDGSDAVIRYVSSTTNDSPQQANLWRRDLVYRVEYPTTLLQTQPEVIFAGGTVTETTSTAEFTFGDVSS